MAEFAEKYKREIGLPFLVLARPNMVTDAYCKELKNAGCHSVTIAIENGNSEIRNKVMLRAMTEELIFGAFENLHRYDLKINSLNMIGLPTETEETVRETLAMNQKCNVHYADASIFQPYPGVSLTKYAIENGWVKDNLTHWGGQYSRSVLKFSEKLKSIFHAYQIIFPLLVEFPWLEKYIGLIRKFNDTKFGGKIMDTVYRISYGLMMTRRIYPVKIPLKLRAFAAYELLVSKHRN